jgi:hypothetical protein
MNGNTHKQSTSWQVVANTKDSDSRVVADVSKAPRRFGLRNMTNQDANYGVARAYFTIISPQDLVELPHQNCIFAQIFAVPTWPLNRTPIAAVPQLLLFNEPAIA